MNPKPPLVFLPLLLCVALAQQRPALTGQLAFVQNGNVWVKTLPDGTPRQVSQGGDARSPRWSASGKWVSFTQRNKVVLVPLRGGDPIALDTHQALWSPKLDEIAFIDQDGISVLRVEPVVQQKRSIFPSSQSGGVSSFMWSPYGSRLAVTVTSQRPTRLTTLWQVNSDGSERRQILFARDDSSPMLRLAGWSSGGRHILMWTGPFSASIAADGLSFIAVSLNSVSAEAHATTRLGDAALVFDEYICASPGGDRVLFVAGHDRNAWLNKRLTLVDLLSGSTSVLTPADSAVAACAWSPDGAEVVYAAGPEARGVDGGEEAKRALSQRRLWTMNAEGGQVRQLTSDPEYRDEYPLWSNDGQHIIFLRMDSRERISVWSLAVHDGTLLKLVEEIAGPPLRGVWFGNHGRQAWSEFIALSQ